MIRDGNERRLVNESGCDHEYPIWSQVQRNDTDKNLVEMEASGRELSGFLRNSSEEIFLKSLMESSIGMAAPNMESLGFKNLSQTLRGDSEELFNSWLLNGENHGCNSFSIAHRTRQASRRLSTELAAFSSQQHESSFQKTNSNENLFQSNLCIFDDLPSDSNQHAVRNGLERGLRASNLFLAKAWLQSSHPVTRSRSSELRKRYAAMQSLQISPGMEATQNTSGLSIHRLRHDFVPVGETSNQLPTFTSPSSSSTTPFNALPVDSVSSVVSMLRGTLERKKLSSSQNDKEKLEGGSFVLYRDQEVLGSLSSDQGPRKQNPEPSVTFHQILSPIPVEDSGNLQTCEGSLEIVMDGFVAPPNPIQMGAMSHEQSQSESSAATPMPSAGFEICDGPANSGQTISVCESSRRHSGNGNSEHSSKTEEFKGRIFENNLKDDPKRGNLIRMRSMTSGGSVEKGDPTKKRRVERSRKMAEAKERSQTPPVPSDVQSILKRCETLEKEVRSLKLNLSFMNRKDSEQTKQIEELQKQNEELTDEKERLLEEIERII